MSPAIAAPTFDGEGDSSPVCATGFELRRKVASLEVGNRASALALGMDPIARDVCTAAVNVWNRKAWSWRRKMLRDYFEPDATGDLYQADLVHALFFCLAPSAIC